MKNGMFNVRGRGTAKYPKTKRAPKSKLGGQSRYGGLRPNRGKGRRGGRKR